MINHARAVLHDLRIRATRRILSHRVQARYPTLMCDPTAIWDYGYNDLDAIELGERVTVQAYAEIVVQKRSSRSAVQGRLVLGDRAIITTGVNIRAAGGIVRIGARSGIGQHSVVVAANHSVKPGIDYLFTDWDEQRTGVIVGENVWVGANSVLLPGITIGNDAVIAAGSVVTRDVPPAELWGGTPARRIRAISGEAHSATT